MIEQLIDKVKIAMKEKQSKDFVREKFNEYFNNYDDMEKTVEDKINHRDLLYDYTLYITEE